MTTDTSLLFHNAQVLNDIKADFPKHWWVHRSNNNANANGGVSYANANNDSSNANTNIGCRLANNLVYNAIERNLGVQQRGRVLNVELREMNLTNSKFFTNLEKWNIKRWVEFGRAYFIAAEEVRPRN